MKWPVTWQDCNSEGKEYLVIDWYGLLSCFAVQSSAVLDVSEIYKLLDLLCDVGYRSVSVVANCIDFIHSVQYVSSN